jgi:hypothetical protein
MAHRKSKKRKNQLVSDKISKLRSEKVPEKQAVAESLSMERSGRLRSGGRYQHKKRGRRRTTR